MTDYLTDAQNDVQTYFETHTIPTYFHQCFFGELVKVWGASLIAPNKDYLVEYDDDGNVIPSNDDDYSYKDQIDYFLTCEAGTNGWNMAFKEACAQCDMTQLYEDYSKMDWVRSDYFDGYIEKQLIDMIFAENSTTDYYYFKLKEGGIYAMPKMS